MRYSSLGSAALLLATLGTVSMPALGAVPAARPAAARVTTAGVALTPQALRQAVVRQVVNNPAVAKLIPRRPVLGGTWQVGAERDVRYVAPGVAAIDYEDGHVAGRLVVR